MCMSSPGYYQTDWNELFNKYQIGCVNRWSWAHLCMCICHSVATKKGSGLYVGGAIHQRMLIPCAPLTWPQPRLWITMRSSDKIPPKTIHEDDGSNKWPGLCTHLHISRNHVVTLLLHANECYQRWKLESFGQRVEPANSSQDLLQK